MLHSNRLIVKARTPISVRLCVRSKTTTLQVRFFVDGQPDGGFSRLKDGTVLHTTDLPWNQKKQCFEGKSAEAARANGKIAGLKADLHAVYDRQKAVGITPTCKTVKSEYFSGIPIEKNTIECRTTVIGCFRSYLDYLKKYGDLTQSTLEKWQYGFNYLTAFLNYTKEAGLGITSINIPWARRFHTWLVQHNSMSADSATRYVNRLSSALIHLVETGEIERNPLHELKLPRGKTKDVYFLENEHLEKFWSLELKGKARVCQWWMGVIFLTGLDYVDAVRYVEDREKHERATSYGKKIVIRRSKPPKAECHIPVLPELEALLKLRPAGSPPPDWEINREMKAVEVLIGFERRLTCKIGRKTAGYLFLQKGFRLEAVSKILGHSSIAITERYYVKATGSIVDREMEKVQWQKSQPISPESYQRIAG